MKARRSAAVRTGRISTSVTARAGGFGAAGGVSVCSRMRSCAPGSAVVAVASVGDEEVGALLEQQPRQIRAPLPDLHGHGGDALEIVRLEVGRAVGEDLHRRSEEHTSELQLRENLVCRLLLE